MNRSNCTNIKQFEGGRVVKQGDSASLSALQSQMTSNIKNKHLELGLDALIDEKLRNGGDNFITSHQASTAYAPLDDFKILEERVKSLEMIPI